MKGARLVTLVVFGCLSINTGCRKESQRVEPVDRAMSWLPPDTETVIAAKGPFAIPAAMPQHGSVTDPATNNYVDLLFQSLPMALLDIQDGLLLSHLKGLPVAAAIEGSRHARSPHSLGEQPYEGAAIVIFDSGAVYNSVELLQALRSSAMRSEEIEGAHVLVFQQKLEEDLWTQFVAFPEKGVLIVATDRGYLEEVLARRSAVQRAALPDSLPEWKFVDRTEAYWGIRHYDKSQAQSDPSSPFGGQKGANFPDELAIGMGFSVSSTNSRRIVLTYLSSDPVMTAANSPLGILAASPDARGIDTRFLQIKPGVVQASSSFTTIGSADTFLFFLEGYLGHAIYL